jgi:hypothetical protein
VSGPVTIRIPVGAADAGCSAFGEAISIAPGTQVTWINDDTIPHTVTSDSGAFDSGVLLPGQSYTHRFSSEGDLTYHCSIHPEMRGAIEVSGPEVSVPEEPGMTPTPSPSVSFSPSPSPSPSATPSPSPRPSPTVIVRQKVVCVVANPCPLQAKTELSCPEQQQETGETPAPPTDGGTPPF